MSSDAVSNGLRPASRVIKVVDWKTVDVAVKDAKTGRTIFSQQAVEVLGQLVLTMQRRICPLANIFARPASGRDELN